MFLIYEMTKSCSGLETGKLIFFNDVPIPFCVGVFLYFFPEEKVWLHCDVVH